MTAISTEVEHARAAGLRYVDDRIPGIRRERIRSGFAFFDPSGKKITDDDELKRIKALAIPPAYEDVWICPLPHGHVQATARDARRKRYRYHKRWREVRDANKFESTVAFGEALGKLRERVEADLKLDCMNREKVIATVVRMLDDTLIRVGNETYARDNDSYGLTTLRPRHVRVSKDKRVIHLNFRGKSGVPHAITIEDPRLAKTVVRCRNLPGELLFSYLDENGAPQPVQSEDVNDYLRTTMGGDFSAKDFRTFAATVICAVELERAGRVETVAEANANVKQAVVVTASKLRNTPTVCRKSYVNPIVIERYLDERVLELPKPRRTAATAGLESSELRVLAFLKDRQGRDEGSERLKKLNRSVNAARAKAKTAASN